MTLKTLRERLCVEELSPLPSQIRKELERLIGMIDVHRPLGADGVHGNNHTRTCGCYPFSEHADTYYVKGKT